MLDLKAHLKAIGLLARWAAKYPWVDLGYRPQVDNPKFMSARDAVGLIPDGAVVMSTGMAGTMRPAVLYRALRRRFDKTGHPRGLSVVVAGGAGGRGTVPGTVEDLGVAGLATRFISGHHETARAFLELGARGECELAVLPQGTITFLAEAQARGEDSVLSATGVGTFIDPRVGAGSQVVPGVGEPLVTVEGEQLRYRMPRVTVASVIATAADEHGNLYMDEAPMYGETREAVRAAKRNGGVAIVTVAAIVPHAPERVFLRADEVDAVVVCPDNEMVLAVKQTAPWRWMTPSEKGELKEIARVPQAVNGLLRLDPVRGQVEQIIGRQAACVFSRVSHPGAHCIVGYGLPQEVGKRIEEGGLAKDVTFLLETGIYGGVPAPGLYFGTAFNPERLMTSAEMFHYCQDHLDTTILGMLQADSAGNVNVSRKSADVHQYIGPGGFIDLVAAAKNIVFVGHLNVHNVVEIVDGRLRLRSSGRPKFVAAVDEITFSGKDALRNGKRGYYVTELYTLELTERGLELVQVAPGVDVERDVLARSEAKIHVPAEVSEYLPAVVSGEGFRLSWAN